VIAPLTSVLSGTGEGLTTCT